MPHAHTTNLVRQNLRLVKKLHPLLARSELRRLSDLTRTLRLSVAQGEILSLDGRWYVTHAGLLKNRSSQKMLRDQNRSARAPVRPAHG